MNGSGCVFQHYGIVPESVYTTDSFSSPLEEAVYKNDLDLFYQNIMDGHTSIVSVGLRIGQMTCIEYAAMQGYVGILQALLDLSINANILKEYFSLTGAPDQAYLLSLKKVEFFKRGALAEAKRYEAALFTAVEYNQPECVALMLRYLGPQEPNKHNFYTENNKLKAFSACELAQVRGHERCFDILSRRRNSATCVPITAQ